jgi:hypothetical protein
LSDFHYAVWLTDTGVIDQDVNLAKISEHLLDQILTGVRIGNVAAIAAMVRSDIICCGSAGRAIQVDNSDPTTGLGKASGSLFSNAAG